MKTKMTLLALATSFALVGCGGGGGSSSTSAPSTQPPTGSGNPVPDPTALQATVPAATYTAGSVESDAFAALNRARAAYGVGQVAQQAALDTAATNHARYILGRFQAGDFAAATHAEDPTKAGFTGTTPAERIAFAKYAAAYTGENLSSIIAVDGVTSAPGAVAVDTLLSGPYHRFSVLDGNRDIGLGFSSGRFAGEGGTRYTVVIELATAQGNQMQAPANDWIGVWPTANATGVMYGLAGESPNPIPANNGACAGYPVSVQAKAGQSLTVSSFTLVEAATGAPVQVQLSTPTTDANPTYARSNSAYIIPFKPLKLATQYTAHFVGARNGVAIDKSWSFTTTGQNSKMVYGCDPS